MEEEVEEADLLSRGERGGVEGSEHASACFT